MKVYTARQAIFNRKLQVVAYELLFRDGPENIFPDVCPHEATTRMIAQTQLVSGIESYTSGKPALINFTRTCLEKDLPTLLPTKKVMIEILETVEPDDAMYEKVRELYHAGYAIALDDFIYEPRWQRFFKFVKLIKFDITKTPLTELGPIVESLKENKKPRILAEKVETQEEYQLAKKMGFDFFQGFFFCRPQMIQSREVESNHLLLLQIYHQLCRPSLSVPKLTKLFEQDLGVTYKLLRYINSGVLPTTAEITSIKQALVYLGEEQTRKLLTILTSAVLGGQQSQEAIRFAIVRARFCELVCERVDKQYSGEAFMMGMLSMLGGLLNQPLDKILAKLPISERVFDALTSNEDSNLRIVFKSVTLYESGQWHLTTLEAEKIGLSYQTLSECYKRAVDWAELYQTKD
ncbi:HDOD domain-containing protein [Alginatibacterium sediminis]|uniref:HDOD domain-containing protein n=1 Tax=Alginatibacterium sediminis TaxID=2164068 RepID=A0A420EGB9_9ALTE|nr:HDOD domain-containing protein [Alginatibacterium sediminis]RKF19704.1 HDOD domain-containing protein [Alginatibacterium sediminis]